MLSKIGGEMIKIITSVRKKKDFFEIESRTVELSSTKEDEKETAEMMIGIFNYLVEDIEKFLEVGNDKTK